MQYVGQTTCQLKRRYYDHCYKIRNDGSTFLYKHFHNTGHTVDNLFIQPVEQVFYNDSDSKSVRIKHILERELHWIKLLQTPYPLGLNDNISKLGNISQIKIDIFDLYSCKLRNKRSHGIRKNGNIKRKLRKNISVDYCYNILINSGRHCLLSCLTHLPISSLKTLDEEADGIYIQTNPLYITASIIQSYTTHKLKPHIDKEEHHKRHFFKLAFLNKGMDFIDLSNIFNDKNVKKSIPNYFKNIESPIISYCYNKPVRSSIFNYNKLVSQFNLDTEIPTSCNCLHSKICYEPVGHIVTGNFEMLGNRKLIDIFSKGPKFRLPLPIDFILCCEEIEGALDLYINAWCKREKAQLNSLNAWRKLIFDKITKRVNFYRSNPQLLPPTPNYSLDDFKHDLMELQDEFVFVPADKAANNVIIV